MDLPTFLQIVQISAYVIGAAIFIVMLKADIRILKHDLNNLEARQDILAEGFKQLTNIMTEVAVQHARIKSIEDDIRELRHGRGFIQDVSGEYSARGKVKS